MKDLYIRVNIYLDSLFIEAKNVLMKSDLLFAERYYASEMRSLTLRQALGDFRKALETHQEVDWRALAQVCKDYYTQDDRYAPGRSIRIHPSGFRDIDFIRIWISENNAVHELFFVKNSKPSASERIPNSKVVLIALRFVADQAKAKKRSGPPSGHRGVSGRRFGR